MLTNREVLHHAILCDPLDDVARLAFADLLQEGALNEEDLLWSELIQTQILEGPPTDLGCCDLEPYWRGRSSCKWWREKQKTCPHCKYHQDIRSLISNRLYFLSNSTAGGMGWKSVQRGFPARISVHFHAFWKDAGLMFLQWPWEQIEITTLPARTLREAARSNYSLVWFNTDDLVTTSLWEHFPKGYDFSIPRRDLELLQDLSKACYRCGRHLAGLPDREPTPVENSY